MPKKPRRKPHKSGTFLDGFFTCVAEAMEKEGVTLTNDEKRKCACVLITLAHRIMAEEYKTGPHWPQPTF